MILKIKNEWEVTEDFDNQRLDYWLKKKISFITYPALCKLIRKGVVRVNGKRSRNSSILNTGDVIKFSRNIEENKKPTRIENYHKKFSEFIKNLVIFKDKFSIVLNKPSGLAVQGGTKIKLNIDLMLDCLKFDYNERPRLVHRIDKQTSGVLLIARTLKSSKYYGNLFESRLIDKKYLAIVHGVPSQKYGKIRFPIISEKKTFQSLTYFKTLDHNNKFAFLLLKPITGRKHQIRTHLNYIGNPICGETKFQDKIQEDSLKINNLHLHAFILSFNEQDGKRKEFIAPIPDYFDSTIKKFNWTSSLVRDDLTFDSLENYKLID